MRVMRSVGHGKRQMIRPYRESDFATVVLLFTESVRHLACEHYDATQLAAWAPRPADLNSWAVRLAGLRTLLAEVNMNVAGFISYERNGHIDLLYVSPLHSRQGIAPALYRDAEAALYSEGISDFVTEASKTARPFFERHGFRVTEEQNVELCGVAFQRYVMRKAIAQQSVPSDNSPLRARRGAAKRER
jgi:putative acetyltransferase